MRDYVDWLGSLLGIWWILAIASFVVSIIIGFTNTILVAVLGVIALAIWAKMERENSNKIKQFFDSKLTLIKEWWARRPWLNT